MDNVTSQHVQVTMDPADKTSTQYVNDTFGKTMFCKDSIWDTDLLLSSSWPQLTSCFQNTVLVYFPFACFWLPLPFYLYSLACTGNRPLPMSSLSIIKIFLATSLSLLSLIMIVEDLSKDVAANPVPSSQYAANGIRVVSYAALAIIIHFERKYHVTTSGVLFVFWMLVVICDVIPLYTQIIQKEYVDSLLKFALFSLIYVMEVLQILVHCVSDSMGEESFHAKTSPEVMASFPSQVFYWWATKTVYKGWKSDLQEEDLFHLNPRDESNTLIPKFERLWINELVRFGRRRGQKYGKYASPHSIRMTDLSMSCDTDRPNERSPLIKHANGKVLANGHKPVDHEQRTRARIHEKKPSLLRVLSKMVGAPLLIGLAQKVVSDIFLMLSPVLLSLLISYAENKDTDFVWKGYALAVLLFITQMVKSVLFNFSFWMSQIVGMQLKSTLIAAIYKKALTMNNESKKDSTAGEIVNLMSVDCQRVQDVMNFFFFAWTTPLQVVIAIAVLYQYIGVSVFAGLAVLLLTVPFNSYIAAKQQTLQVENLKYKDARLRLTNEALCGMKVLKLYAWEPPFHNKISDIRGQETRVLLKIAYLNVLISVCFNAAPYLVMLATFAVYVTMSEDNHLDANKAFVALSFFNLLRVPLALLSTIISMSVQAVVSIERINAFLCTGDLRPDNVVRDSRANFAIEVENGFFTWDKSAGPTLRNINLRIPEGKLYAVVGPVGCGKSSLMSALLGEMERLSGTASIKSKLAYVPQQAWIQNATVKDNILFGKPFSKKRYKKVISACALERDLEILSAGDMTEIGEKGINLSGGQKQRVSLARAVYSNADIFIFDDPLSAVDTHVGKHIFNKVIGHKGMLKGKTRVLVTHGAHWLPMVDSIMVLENGEIRESGSYEDLMSHNGAFAEFIKTYLLQGDDKDEETDPEIQAMKSKIWNDVETATSDATSGDDGHARPARLTGRKRKQWRRSNGSFIFKYPPNSTSLADNDFYHDQTMERPPSPSLDEFKDLDEITLLLDDPSKTLLVDYASSQLKAPTYSLYSDDTSLSQKDGSLVIHASFTDTMADGEDKNPSKLAVQSEMERVQPGSPKVKDLDIWTSVDEETSHASTVRTFEGKPDNFQVILSVTDVTLSGDYMAQAEGASLASEAAVETSPDNELVAGVSKNGHESKQESTEVMSEKFLLSSSSSTKTLYTPDSSMSSDEYILAAVPEASQTYQDLTQLGNSYLSTMAARKSLHSVPVSVEPPPQQTAAQTLNSHVGRAISAAGLPSFQSAFKKPLKPGEKATSMFVFPTPGADRAAHPAYTSTPFDINLSETMSTAGKGSRATGTTFLVASQDLLEEIGQSSWRAVRKQTSVSLDRIDSVADWSRVDKIPLTSNSDPTNTAFYESRSDVFSPSQGYSPDTCTPSSRRSSNVSFQLNRRPSVHKERTMSMTYESSMTTSLLMHSQTVIYEEEDKGGNALGKLVQAEKLEKGKVKMAVFWAYSKASGTCAIAVSFLFFALFQVASAWSNFWLTDWTDDPYLANTSHLHTNEYKEKNDFYLWIFGVFGIAQVAFLTVHNILYWIRMVVAAKRLHYGMLTSIFRSPMSFFDTTPLGRIMNRFSRDIEVVDNNLPIIIRDYTSTLFTCLVTLIIISMSTPLFLSLVFPIMLLYYLIQNFYIPTSRQLKRIESVTRSPIYSHFSETISGGPTIRAYEASARFIKESKARVDRNQSFYYISLAANRWLGMNLELLANIIILGSAIFAVVTPGISGGDVGLSVSYAIQVSSNLVWMVRQMSDLETNIVSVERLKEYSELESEADWVVPRRRPIPGWPIDGKVKFSNYQTRYRPGLDLVLKGITCEFQAGEKIGIVGRTGAGKSSLALALFRLIEATEGSITVDGIRISDIGIHDVRSRLTILPQDPVLFFGSLRMNLDPIEEYDDSQLWDALTSAHLKDFVENTPEGLDYEVGEEGQSLSVGQRQLVCLARALLKKTKILILDEATAAVDMETDTLIQNTIRTEFNNCTIITIAHRLNTIMDYDRIMVLDAGLVKELDSPSNLLANHESIFYSMAKEANLI